MDLAEMERSEAAMMEGKKCVKCPEAAHYAGVDPKKAVYCRPCFITMVKNKFRSTLSKRRIFKDGESRDTLVVFDGTSSAAFLLHQIQDALNQVSYKRLMIQPVMLVLVSSLSPSAFPEIEEKVCSLRSLLPATQWIIVHLAAALTSSDRLSIDLTQTNCQATEQIPVLEDLLNCSSTPTARAEIIRIARERACERVARQLGINKVMLPDDGDILGRMTLAQLCLGRGSTISDLSSVLDRRPSGISFIRPLRDVSQKEIAIVNHLECYETSTIRVDEPKGTVGSIHAITTNFVDTLIGEGFKSTVTTVLSTASKLHSLPSDVICSLCQLGAVLQPAEEERAAEQGSPLCPSCSDLLKEIQSPHLIRDLLLV